MCSSAYLFVRLAVYSMVWVFYQFGVSLLPFSSDTRTDSNILFDILVIFLGISFECGCCFCCHCCCFAYFPFDYKIFKFSFAALASHRVRRSCSHQLPHPRCGSLLRIRMFLLVLVLPLLLSPSNIILSNLIIKSRVVCHVLVIVVVIVVVLIVFWRFAFFFLSTIFYGAFVFVYNSALGCVASYIYDKRNF